MFDTIMNQNLTAYAIIAAAGVGFFTVILPMIIKAHDAVNTVAAALN